MDTLDNLTRNFAADGLPGADAALNQVTGMVRQQAWVMSFADVFWVLTLLFAGLAIAAMMMKKPEAAAAPAGH